MRGHHDHRLYGGGVRGYQGRRYRGRAGHRAHRPDGGGRAAYMGAARIIGVGTARSVDLAREYGATDVISYRDGDVVEQVLDMTDGLRADGVIICGGGDAVFTRLWIWCATALERFPM